MVLGGVVLERSETPLILLDTHILLFCHDYSCLLISLDYSTVMLPRYVSKEYIIHSTNHHMHGRG